MPSFETADHTRMYYTDWGAGPPLVFLSSWAFGGAMWEYQTLPLSEQGLRCIAYDRRGHGRSDDPGRGYDFDTLADDLAALLAHLDISDVTLVGHSVGCCEIARYLARHGTGRIKRAVFVSPATPFVLQNEDNPQGAPADYLERHLIALGNDRPAYFSADAAISFFGLGTRWPDAPVLSNEMVDWAIRLILASSPKAVMALRRASNETDFRPDLSAFALPTLIIHGDQDQSAPLEACGRRTAQAIAGSRLIVYEGAPHGLFLTERKRLTDDLRAFVLQA